MASVNKVILVGNIGKDPEIRYMPNGNPVTNLSIATSRKKDGQEYTQWHRCVAYEKNADLIGKYAKKGKQIYIEGEIRYGKFTNKDGVEQHTTDIVIHQVQLLGSRDQEPEPVERKAPQPTTGGNGGFDDDQDIPF